MGNHLTHKKKERRREKTQDSRKKQATHPILPARPGHTSRAGSQYGNTSAEMRRQESTRVAEVRETQRGGAT
ncbi:hypothetical protein E2C01_047163 [Portunus trituberculatus]|uniref:Uncharacterized protein n=1 Tax=Portunus trituberculatus TaxID=210409 RepID=A0A5B7G9Q2_PORTR|nr:hypothetical protein [Portunus trituberculatus]